MCIFRRSSFIEACVWDLLEGVSKLTTRFCFTRFVCFGASTIAAAFFWLGVTYARRLWLVLTITRNKFSTTSVPTSTRNKFSTHAHPQQIQYPRPPATNSVPTSTRNKSSTHAHPQQIQYPRSPATNSVPTPSCNKFSTHVTPQHI